MYVVKVARICEWIDSYSVLFVLLKRISERNYYCVAHRTVGKL